MAVREDNSARWRECSTSLDRARRAFKDTGWGRHDVVEGLRHAAYGGSLDVVKWICATADSSADFPPEELVNAQSELLGLSPLCLAASVGHLDVVQWLVDKGARRNEKCKGGRTEIHEAASGGHLSILSYLVGEGTCVNEKDDDGDTTLHEAARYGHLTIAQFLVEKGVCTTERNDLGETAMDVAAARGHFAVVQFLRVLVWFNWDAEEAAEGLLSAAFRGELEMVKGLCDVAEDRTVLVNEKDGNGQTALHWAAKAKMPNLSLIQFLVGQGVRVFDADKWGNTALFYAAVEYKFEVVEFVLKEYLRDKKKPSLDDKGKTLFAAAKSDRVDLVEHLKNHFRTNVRFVDSHGRSALHEAAVGGALKCVNLLLASRVGVHQTDSFGVTPVIESCRHGQSDVLNRLLACKGNASDVDMAGRTALHYAAEGGHLAVVNTLLAHEVDINCSDKIGWTPLHCASAAGYLEVARILLDNGADVDKETISGKTATILSVGCGHYEVLSLLCSEVRDAPLNVTASDGYNENIIDPSDLLLDLSSGGKNYWLGVPVEIKSKKRRLTNFVEELDRWSNLDHPNIAQLFGVWYRENDEACFVSEFATQGSLLENLSATPAILWERLYGAALGLQYLHDRNIIHGQLNCDSIVITESGLAKLRNFGIEHTSRFEWTAPELLCGLPLSFESDIYAFGIAIVEAFMDGSSPWGFTGSVLKDAIRSGKLPHKPSQMTASQWMLIERMCCFNPGDRLSAPDIVRELKMFLDEYSTLGGSSAMPDETMGQWNKLSEVAIASTTVSNLLAGIKDMCQDATETNDMFRKVYVRLDYILNLLNDRYRSLSGAIVHRYCIIVLYLHRRMSKLLVAKSSPEAHFAALGQVFADIFATHKDLDVLLSIADLPGGDNVHQWQKLWERRRGHQMNRIMQTLKKLQDARSSGAEKAQREEALLSLRHELNKPPTRLLLSDEVAALKTKLLLSSQWMPKAAEWFIPEYDVVFDNLGEFTDGGIGSAHVGKWNQARVLVIKLGKQLQTKAFNSYVETWYKLRHLHVMKLFGACHVKQTFLVCEYTREQLGQYLHCHPDEIWRKLYEAALGLRYLHAKHVVHGNLNDASFVLGADGCVKITNFGLSTLEQFQKQCCEEPESESDSNAQEQISDMKWKAPELFDGEKATVASDIFSFGTFILRAVAGLNPCADTADANRKKPRLSLRVNKKIHDLVAEMHSDDPLSRPLTSKVVRILGLLTDDFQQHELESGELDVVPVCWSSLGGVRICSGNATGTVSSLLAEIDDNCKATVACVTRDVYERLVDIFSQLKARRGRPSKESVDWFKGIISDFHEQPLCQDHENTASVHRRLDEFMEFVRIPRSGPLHQWRGQLDLAPIEELSEIPMESLPPSKLQSDQKEYDDDVTGISDCFSVDRSSSIVENTSGAECVVPLRTVSKYETWFIPEYEVAFVDTDAFSRGGFGQVFRGKWRRAEAVVKTVKLKTDKQQIAFLNEVEIWHKLNHPHVVQLFGACHTLRPFFVCENAKGGQLDRYLRIHPNEVWNKLYEAAMGLQYLHEMGVIHGDLKCNNILVGSDGLAKLTDFGLSRRESDVSCGDDEICETTAAIRWIAPEVLRGEKVTFASDIYAFGMCILEATSGVHPWGDFDGFTVRRHVLKYQSIPMRPLKCSETMYRQVERMCSFNAVDRLFAADVVRRLEVFTQTSERSETSVVDLAKLDEMPKAWVNLEDALVATASTAWTLSSLLTTIDEMCEGSTTMDFMNQAVYSRLENVFNQLKSELHDLTQDTVRQYVRQYGAILYFFYNELERTRAVRLSGVRELSFFTATRLGIETARSVHSDVDLFVKSARLSWLESDRKWRDQWEVLRSEQQSEVVEKLKNLPAVLENIDDTKNREGALELLRFELTTHPTSYASITATDVTQAKHAIASLLTSTTADWFIPPHEVTDTHLTNTHLIAQGSFGSVYLGEWKHARIVVKKMERELYIDFGQRNHEIDYFPNEVQIWHRLRHPHVVQMFGACHLGDSSFYSNESQSYRPTRFFVCEYAARGELGQYLRDHPNEKWEKLYEVALGLRYVHIMGVVHGDLKCSNIVVGGDCRAKITDFGLSWLEGDSPLCTGPNVGAVQWKAPEVLRGEKYTFASDIYSFGMCILEAVSGKLPWGFMDNQIVRYLVVKQQLPPRPKNCRDEEYALVEHMCRYDPSERLTMKEVVDSLNTLR